MIYKTAFKFIISIAIFYCELAFADDIGLRSFSWDKTQDSIALKNGKTDIWRFNISQKCSRPYFCPVSTLSGKNLVVDAPKDHIWHTGLFFQWKFIESADSNGKFGKKNLYWEYKGKGRTRWSCESINLRDDFSARIVMNLEYFPEGNSNFVELSEQRILDISAPDKSGNYYIIWDMKFTSNHMIRLDVTTPNPKIWYGGYAGISARTAMSKYAEIINAEGLVQKLSNSSNTTNGDKIMGMKSSGIACNMIFEDGNKASLSIVEDLRNDRAPSPNYSANHKIQGKDRFTFISLAYLFDEPKILHKNEILHLRYKTIISETFKDRDLLRKDISDFQSK